MSLHFFYSKVFNLKFFSNCDFCSTNICVWVYITYDEVSCIDSGIIYNEFYFIIRVDKGNIMH